ncbi:MAG TPA: hypothetical protein VGM29_05405 [Polyangiaceae bacterium]|jgi:hypothetical protein
MSRWLSLFWVGVFVVACGGKSHSDDATATGASAGTSGDPQGGAGGSAGTGGAGSGGGPSACAPLVPVAGSACTSKTCCNYTLDACTSLQACCNGAVWVVSESTSGAAYDCSSFSVDNLPQDGTSCACMGTLNCVYGDCASGVTRVTCDGSVWSVKAQSCPQPTACGPSLTCNFGEVCTADEQLGGIAYACHPDPCLQQNRGTSCDCASTLCGSYESCSLNGSTIYCSCPSC